MDAGAARFSSSPAAGRRAHLKEPHPKDSSPAIVCNSFPKKNKPESSSEKALRKHTTMKHNGCSKCNKFFADRTALDKHRMDVHNFFTSGKSDLTDRQNNSSSKPRKKGPNHCHFCWKTFRDVDDLNTHLEMVHFISRQCQRSRATYEDLVIHLDAHRNPEIQCRGCVKPFPTYSLMVAHLEDGSCSSGFNRDEMDHHAIKLGYLHYDYIFPDICPGNGSYSYRNLSYDGNRGYWEQHWCKEEGGCHEKYQCATCKAPFGSVSQLFGHVEEWTCRDTGLQKQDEEKGREAGGLRALMISWSRISREKREKALLYN